VHAWAKFRLKSEPQKEIEVATEAFEIFTSGVPNSDEQHTEDWIFERRVMPYIDTVAKHIIMHIGVSDVHIHDGSGCLGNVYRRHGWYNEVLEWYGRALTGYERALGVDHSDSLNIVPNMAVVFNIQGLNDKALEWYSRALVGWEKALGVDHPDTLTTVHTMALVFENQGQYDKALEWYGRALAG